MSRFNKEFIQYSETKVKKETNNLTLFFIITIPLYICLLFFAIFIAWYVVFTSTHRYFAVYGPSMMSTLNAEITNINASTNQSFDAVYVKTYGTVDNFDIIVLKNPRNLNDSIIKRLMAQEGDYVSIVVSKNSKDEESLFLHVIEKGTDLSNFEDQQAKLVEDQGINGYNIYGYNDWNEFKTTTSLSVVNEEGQTKTHFYEEKFFETFQLQDCKNENALYEYFISKEGVVYVKVPENKMFCVGDNRGHSTDSREWGFFDKSTLIGKTEFIIYDHNFGNRLWEVLKFYFKEIEKFFAR